MSNTNDMFVETPSGGYSFEQFKAAYPKYLDSLNNHMKLLFNTYILVHNYRFLKLNKNPECLEIAKRCGFGMLMRHALEVISTSLATENGLEVSARSVFERLQALKGQNIPELDKDKKAVLSKLLDLTNEIAHPHVLHKEVLSFEQLHSFYTDSFKAVLSSHISYIENIIKTSRTNDFGIPKEVSHARKQAFKYLSAMKKRLDSFNVFDKTTNILVQGCLVRQLTECTANLWGYNYQLVPTDVSTYENQINLSNILDSLNRISRAGKRTAFGSSALTPYVVSNLHTLKNVSNAFMHVDKFATENLVKQGEALSELYETVKAECTPHVMKNKLSEAESLSRIPVKAKKPREKSPFIATLLCGTLGWSGAHHFYLGNISKGITYLLFFGFIIGPALDLYRLLKGMFRNSKGLRFGKTPLSSVAAVIFLIIHLALIFSFSTKVFNGEIAERLKEFNPIKAVSVEKCDGSELESLTMISVSDSTSSSHLKTSKKEFDASLCVDGKSSTCWQDGIDGPGEGESLTFTFDEKQKITAFSILNGKFTSEKDFYNNARVENITVKIGSKKYPLALEDVMERQSFILPSAKETEQITFIIDSAYPGNKWQDLCISEIEFYKEAIVNEE